MVLWIITVTHLIAVPSVTLPAVNPASIVVLRPSQVFVSVLIPSDGVFGGLITLLEQSAGQVRLRASAAFQGQLRRVLSDVVTVEISAAGLPDGPRPLNITNVVEDLQFGGSVLCNELFSIFCS